MLTRGEGLVGHVIKTGQSAVVPDVRLDPRYVVGRAETLSEIAIPILLNDHIIGALNLENDRLAAFDENDLELLRFFADAAAVSVDKAMLHKKLVEKEHTDQQLRIAHEVQMQLVPERPPHIPGYEITGLCLPTFDIGGDYFDYIDLKDGNLGIALADVSGHGIPAALVMSAFRALLRTQARLQSDPATVAKVINQSLPEFTGRSDFVTAVYGVLNPTSGQFIYTNCGHSPPLFFRPDGVIEKLSQGGPALGVFDDHEFGSGQQILIPGGLLVMYTDGVTETFAPDGESFGLERLIGVIRQNLALPVQEIIAAVVNSIRSFSGSDGFLDDFTLVVVRRRDGNEVRTP
jgi:phosphoserine phosphatase RsbU/P